MKPNAAGTGGRIVFISATLHYRTTPFQAHVSAAKAGIDALSHTVSLEFGPLGVTSNIISPGPIAGTEVRPVSPFPPIFWQLYTYKIGHGPTSPIGYEEGICSFAAAGSHGISSRYRGFFGVPVCRQWQLREWTDSYWYVLFLSCVTDQS